MAVSGRVCQLRTLQRTTIPTRSLVNPTMPVRRRLHSKPSHRTIVTEVSPASISRQVLAKALPPAREENAPISAAAHLSFFALLQTYIMTACTSSPLIISPSIKVLSTIAHSKSAFLSADRNPIIHWLLKNTIYRHFCAGENAGEVQDTITRLRNTGIKGIMLCYAREVELRGEEEASTTSDLGAAEQEINSWAEGVMKTIRIVPEGNFVSIKFSGAGQQTLYHLQHSLPPPDLLQKHLEDICSLAHSRRIRLCIDAEQTIFQPGIDSWTLALQRRFNSLSPASSTTSSETKPWACIYNTYQTYLCSSPSTLADHLTLAQKENFILGVKLVRGAYLASEERSLFWPTKEQTDTCFDELARGLIQQDRKPILALARHHTDHPISSASNISSTQTDTFPEVALVLATHNLASARKALNLRQDQALHGEKRIDMVYAQLQGMADHVTGELIGAAKAASSVDQNTNIDNDGINSESVAVTETDIEIPHVCKYLTWGSVGECAGYLVRRAEENRDAVARTVESRRVLGAEILRRIGLGSLHGGER